MPVAYLLDEHLRGGGLWQAIQQHNAGGGLFLDVVRVGDPPDLPLGRLDPEILLWTERQGRILVSNDRQTLPGHLADHLTAGHHSPGVLLIRRGSAIVDLVDALVLRAHAGFPADFADQARYIP
jgi:hypothetical protein